MECQENRLSVLHTLLAFRGGVAGDETSLNDVYKIRYQFKVNVLCRIQHIVGAHLYVLYNLRLITDYN